VKAEGQSLESIAKPLTAADAEEEEGHGGVSSEDESAHQVGRSR
jgi:hypothetical protein